MESRKSSTGSTIPRPIRWNQIRLTRLRAKNGLSWLVSQAARRTRRSDFGILEHRTAQRLGLHHLAGARLADVAGVGRVNDLLLRQVPLLAADLREEGGEAVVVVLGPPLEGVVVALGALDADPQEELGGRLDGGLRVAADPVVVGRRVRVGRAVGGQERADELVHRHVPLERGTDPAVEDVGALGLDQPAVGAEDVGELEGPEVVELGPLQQPSITWPRRSAAVGGQELLDLPGRGQDPDRVEVDPADELLVGAQLRRADPHPVELGEDGAIDHVVLGNLRQLEAGHLDQVGEPDVRDQVEVVGDDGDLAPVLEPDERVGVDLGDVGAGRVVVADRGHVADGAVGQVEQDHELLGLGRRIEHPRLGQGSRA